MAGPQAGPGGAGRVGLYPIHPQRGSSLIYLLLGTVRTPGLDRDHQFEVCRLGKIFGDERLTAALLDRLAHHAHMLELVGELFRFRQRLQEKQDEFIALGTSDHPKLKGKEGRASLPSRRSFRQRSGRSPPEPYPLPELLDCSMSKMVGFS